MLTNCYINHCQQRRRRWGRRRTRRAMRAVRGRMLAMQCRDIVAKQSPDDDADASTMTTIYQTQTFTHTNMHATMRATNASVTSTCAVRPNSLRPSPTVRTPFSFTTQFNAIAECQCDIIAATRKTRPQITRTEPPTVHPTRRAAVAQHNS